MTSPLRKSLERLVSHVEIPADEIWSEKFICGAKHHHARLAPVIAALLDCVDALEKYTTHVHKIKLGDGSLTPIEVGLTPAGEALAALRKFVGE